jgi:hypothetical protein
MTVIAGDLAVVPRAVFARISSVCSPGGMATFFQIARASLMNFPFSWPF